MPKGSTPWSTRTIAEGGTDSPVGDLVPVPDSAQPVINAGFIDEAGKWRVDATAADTTFTLSNIDEAIAAGASMFVDPLNMLNHNTLILALKDSSGNGINVDVDYMAGGAATGGPYAASFFVDDGVTVGNWKSNDPGDGSGGLINICQDTNETLATSWQLLKVTDLIGTLGQMRIRSNEGVNAGTLSAAWLRIP